MHRIKDGARILEFEGELLSTSSSRKNGSLRWVEFELYRTLSGSYVISRTGHSMMYHSGECEVTARNSIKPQFREALTASSVPCVECQPESNTSPEIFPERPRHWALVTDTPDGVVDALYKYDSQDARYLTHVARILIEIAAEKDSAIDRAYRVERIR